jgi:hypothetical protein
MSWGGPGRRGFLAVVGIGANIAQTVKPFMAAICLGGLLSHWSSLRYWLYGNHDPTDLSDGR